MNKSYSKIRHIQESNVKLEKRLLKEQDENKSEQKVQELLKSGYKVVDKINLPDGSYKLTGSVNSAYILDSEKQTGYVVVVNYGIRGSFDNQVLEIKDGLVNEKRFWYGVYKILYNESTKGQ